MKNEKNFVKQIIIFTIISLVSILVLNAVIMPQFGKRSVKDTNYSFFLNQLDEGNITQVKIEDSEIRFEVENEDGKTQIYSTGRMDDPDLVTRLHKDKDIIFTESFEESNLLLEFLVSWVLPIIFFIILWNVLIKSMSKRMGGGNAMQFGKSNAKIYVKAQTGKTFADVAGQDEAEEALVE